MTQTPANPKDQLALDRTGERRGVAALLAVCLGALPLGIYPFLIVGNIMSLAGHRTGNEPALLIAISSAFLWGSLVYPAVYLPCTVISYLMAKAHWAWTSFVVSLISVVYLFILAGLFILWAVLE